MAYNVICISLICGNWGKLDTKCKRRKGVLQMRLSYNKLQKLMIDNQMKRNDLIRAAEITPYVATKINKNEPVSLEVLMRICKVFHCDIGDICEVILD